MTEKEGERKKDRQREIETERVVLNLYKKNVCVFYKHQQIIYANYDVT